MQDLKLPPKNTSRNPLKQDVFLDGLAAKMNEELRKGNEEDHAEMVSEKIISYFSNQFQSVERFHDWVEQIAEWYATTHSKSDIDNWVHAEEIAALYIMEKIMLEEDYPTCPSLPGS